MADCDLAPMGRFSLIFSDYGLEKGFINGRSQRLAFAFKWCAAILTLASGAAWLMTQPWVPFEEKTLPIDINSDAKAVSESATMMNLVVSLCSLALFLVFSVERVVRRIGVTTMEVVITTLMIVFLLLQTLTLHWYMACFLGYDPVSETNIVHVDNRHNESQFLLAIVGIVAASHLVLPLRFYICICTEVAGVALHIVTIMVFGGPEVQYFHQRTLLLAGIVGMCSMGKRNIEWQERALFTALLNEKSLRVQSEFELSRLQSVPRSTEYAPSETESRPETTDSGRVFTSSNEGVGRMLRDILPVGRKEQWLVHSAELDIPSRVKVLGEGGFGRVIQAEYLGLPVAIKIPKAQEGAVVSASHLVQLCNELRILRRLRHPNIVVFFGACVDEQRGTLSLVLELIRGVTLKEFIWHGAQDWVSQSSQDTPGRGPCEPDRARVLVQVTSALRYLHSRAPPVVHGDLKDSNVFVELAFDGSPPVAKLLDFGLSRTLTRNARPMGGTLCWVAPEVMEGQRMPSRPADVFSFGRIMFFVATSQHPPVLGEQARAVESSGNLWGLCRELSERCASRSPVSRPSMEEVYEQASGWLQAVTLPEQQSQPRKPHEPPHGAEFSTAITPSPLNANERVLLVASRKQTPTYTVQLLISELMLACNLEISRDACCHFHGTLQCVGSVMDGLQRGKCREWRAEQNIRAQCASCGVLDRRKLDDDEDLFVCRFCMESFTSYSGCETRSSESSTILEI